MLGYYHYVYANHSHHIYNQIFFIYILIVTENITDHFKSQLSSLKKYCEVHSDICRSICLFLITGNFYYTYKRCDCKIRNKEKKAAG